MPDPIGKISDSRYAQRLLAARPELAAEIAAPAPFNLICFRHTGGDEINQRILERLNRSGKLYLSHTVLDGRYTLRLCVGQTHTEARHVQAAWQQIQEAAEK